MRRACFSAVLFFVLLVGLVGSATSAGDFEVFDGRFYNGKFYPRIDVIEWNDAPGSPSYMTFHVYDKLRPVEMSFHLEESQKKKVMLVNYHLTDRKEHQCRRVLAPIHFTQGYLVYRDKSDPDYDEIIVSMHEMPAKRGRALVKPAGYAACVTEEPLRLPASDAAKPGDGSDQKRKNYDRGAIKKEGQSAPFSDW